MFENLTDLEIIEEIIKCEREITKVLTQPNIDQYPGEIMRLGDFYCEKYLLMNELLRRRK